MNIHPHAHDKCPETPCVGPRCRAETGKTQTKRDNMNDLIIKVTHNKGFLKIDLSAMLRDAKQMPDYIQRIDLETFDGLPIAGIPLQLP